jgi:lysozyme family protein
MRKFDDYIKIILLHEGGYINDPLDPGGETNYGISKRQYPNLDIKNLTEKQASDIYFNDYWTPMNLDILKDELLKLHLFDMGINAGIKSAIKLLQQIVSTKEDGILGNITAERVNYILNIVELYKLKRIEYYNSLVLKNSKLKKFLNGWINRVNLTNFK